MSEPARTPPPAVAAPHEIRLEYRGFRNTELRREFLVHARIGGAERDYVVAIAHAAFADRRVSLQDGPDVCFQRLRRELSGGALAELDRLDISDDELVSYRAAQKTVTRRRQRAPAPRPGEDAVP
ncbi:MAG TPA: hypothetical protein VMX54_02175 [Vicinamibacteria bacterium]|nr:hypothetical protein [Vicinamibacteria bacterium]